MAKDPFPQDHGWAWAIVVGCFVCVFFMVGTSKSTGMFLTEFQDYFNVPTSLAAMLMGGSSIVYAILAPVCIILGQMFTVRQVILAGAFIGFIGMSLGSLLFSMEYVIATFGICFGIGNATVYGNCLVILGVYFSKRRALANGLALAGASIGQFAMPPFIEYLLEEYGLQGCILLIGGVYFHLVAAACLFRPPSFWTSLEDTEIAIQGREEENVNGDLRTDIFLRNSISSGLQNEKMNSIEGNEVVKIENIDDQSSKRHKHSHDRDSAVSPLMFPTMEAGFTELKENESPSKLLMYRTFMASTGSLCMHPLSIYGSSLLFEPHDLEFEAWMEDRDGKKISLCKKLMIILDFSVMKSYVAVFVTFCSFLTFFGYFNFVLFLPAAVLARGISKYDKAILVSVCGIGDLVGRLSTAAIGDRNFVSRYKLQAIGTVFVSLNIGCFVFANTFGWMMAHCALYGFFGGIFVSLGAVVITDFVGIKRMPRLLAVVMLIQGIGASVGQPLLGGVKDITGSFQPVIIICAVTCFAGGLALLCYPLVLKLEYRRPEPFRLLPAINPTH